MELFYSIILISILHLLFYQMGAFSKWDQNSKMVFECGFSSYFFSRFSFSIHYFLIALTFLLLDLELSFLLPFFNEETFFLKTNFFFIIFSLILTLGLIMEWNTGLINWKN